MTRSDTPPEQARAALVVGGWPTSGQTFVARHAAHLFGGNTCVVANAITSAVPPHPPVFDRSAFRRGPVERALAAVTIMRNALVLGTGKVPVGSERAALIGFLREQHVTVVLSEFGTKAVVLADIAAELGLPCYTYFRGSDASREVGKPRRKKTYAHVIPQLAGIVAVSQYLLDNLAAEGITHPNAHVIPSGVDVRRFRPGEKEPGTFLAVGRMVEKKAPDITLRAFAEATRDRPEARLRFIGDGPQLAALRAMAFDLGVAEKVRFDGARPHEIVREALARSEIFLQHSVTARDGNAEGLPTAIQEALASGCVVVSTRHAGIPEAVEHGVTGWLCEERDLDGFTARIRESLTADKTTMAETARRVACERFDNDKLLQRLEDLLRQPFPPMMSA